MALISSFLAFGPVAGLLAQEQPVDPKIDTCGDPGSQSTLCSTVFDITESETAAEVADALNKPVQILLIVIGAFVINFSLRLIIRRFVKRLQNESTQSAIRRVRKRTGVSLLDTTGHEPDLRRAQRAQALGSVLRSVSSVVVWTVAAFLVLDEIGINLGPLLAGAGIIGLALGFGAQSLVKDFLAGIFMLVEDQIGVGDIVDLGPASGTVENVSLRVTRIRDVEGIVWYVPNGEIQRVANKSQQWSRALLDISVAYDTPIELATRVIKQVADGLWRDDAWSALILEEPEVWGVQDFGPDAIVIRLVVKTKPLEQWNIQREIRRRIKHAFDEAGIEIPFPQRTLWHRFEPSATPGAAPPPSGDASAEDTEPGP